MSFGARVVGRYAWALISAMAVSKEHESRLVSALRAPMVLARAPKYLPEPDSCYTVQAAAAQVVGSFECDDYSRQDSKVVLARLRVARRR